MGRGRRNREEKSKNYGRWLKRSRMMDEGKKAAL
jgi:hypothetical protein